MKTITYLDRILYLYPDVQNVVVWQQKTTQLGFAPELDGQPLENPYDGIIWESTKYAKPDQKTLDALPEDKVLEAKEERRKSHRDMNAKKDLAILAAFTAEKKNSPTLTMREFMDNLEILSTEPL